MHDFDLDDASLAPECCPDFRARPLTGANVLLVEDDAILAGALRRLVERKGGSVAIAPSVDLARCALETEPLPSVALLDLELCDGTGLELAEACHASQTTFIVHTGYSWHYLDACVHAGAWDVLEKPSNPAELVVALRAGAERTRRIRQRMSRGFGPQEWRGTARGAASGAPVWSTGGRDRAAVLFQDLVRRVREATVRSKKNALSRTVEVAILSALGLGIKRIAVVTGTSPSNVNQCLNIIRDRAGWASSQDGFRWHLAQSGVDFRELLVEVLSNPAELERALRELSGPGAGPTR